jgi:HTH-type transcriptional regulator/antitoxin HipB
MGSLTIHPDVFAAVRFHRRRADLTQAELAALARVGKTVIFDIERGKRTVRLETLLRVLDVLNMRLEWQSPLRTAFEEEMRHASREHPGPR